MKLLLEGVGESGWAHWVYQIGGIRRLSEDGFGCKAATVLLR